MICVSEVFCVVSDQCVEPETVGYHRVFDEPPVFLVCLTFLYVVALYSQCLHKVLSCFFQRDAVQASYAVSVHEGRIVPECGNPGNVPLYESFQKSCVHQQ